MAVESRYIDLNCDMGEGLGVEHDALIMPHISSANIACGFHAGDMDTMHATVAEVIKHGVSIGAHPGYPDRENFGRVKMDMSLDDMASMLLEQIQVLHDVVATHGGRLSHVKPHGALYNASAQDYGMALRIAEVVRDFDRSLVLFVPAGSAAEDASCDAGVFFARELFADRNYLPDGSLVPRSEPYALLSDSDVVVPRVVAMVRDQRLEAVDGSILDLKADTLCIHGDHPGSAELAGALRRGLEASGIEVRSESRVRQPVFIPNGDQSLLIRFCESISESTVRRVISASETIESAGIRGVVETVPAYTTLMVVYDPSEVKSSVLCERIRDLPDFGVSSVRRRGRLIEIPVCYDASLAPDMEIVSRHTGLSTEEIIDIHSSGEYRVYFLGFQPGFVYLGGMDSRLACPRKDTPRIRVPEGSVGIAGKQTGVYPLESPGGWQIIGRSLLRLFDPDRKKPFLAQHLDNLRFVPISRDEYLAQTNT